MSQVAVGFGRDLIRFFLRSNYAVSFAASDSAPVTLSILKLRGVKQGPYPTIRSVFFLVNFCPIHPLTAVVRVGISTLTVSHPSSYSIL